MLLDLHNLHANALNFGFDPRAYLATLPLERVTQIHVAGGRWVERHGERRLLDDHLHPVPDPVFALLAEVAAQVEAPLTVVLERDGRYGSIGDLLAELDHAREVVRTARAGRPGSALALDPGAALAPAAEASAPRPGGTSRAWRLPWRARAASNADAASSIEAGLARIYVDDNARADFLATTGDIDRAGLELAAESFARKRARAQAAGGWGWTFRSRR